MARYNAEMGPPVFAPLLLAMVGGMAAPWTLGYLADMWGIGAVMIVPLFGTCMVFILILLIWLESKIAG